MPERKETTRTGPSLYPVPYCPDAFLFRVYTVPARHKIKNDVNADFVRCMF